MNQNAEKVNKPVVQTVFERIVNNQYVGESQPVYRKVDIVLNTVILPTIISLN